MGFGFMYNMATTFHEGTLQIFVNGKLVSTLTAAGNRSHLLIGRCDHWRLVG